MPQRMKHWPHTWREIWILSSTIRAIASGQIRQTILRMRRLFVKPLEMHVNAWATWCRCSDFAAAMATATHHHAIKNTDTSFNQSWWIMVDCMVKEPPLRAVFLIFIDTTDAVWPPDMCHRRGKCTGVCPKMPTLFLYLTLLVFWCTRMQEACVLKFVGHQTVFGVTYDRLVISSSMNRIRKLPAMFAILTQYQPNLGQIPPGSGAQPWLEVFTSCLLCAAPSCYRAQQAPAKVGSASGHRSSEG